MVYAVIYEKAQDYEVAAYLEASFEFVGRSVIWIGDALGELAGGRYCCFKVNLINNKKYLKINIQSRMRKLSKATQDLGNDIYAKFTTTV